MRCLRLKRRTIGSMSVLVVILIMVFKHLHNKGTPESKKLGWIPPKYCSNCEIEPLSLSDLPPNLLLVLIHSSASRRDRRDAIRQTWLSGFQNSLNAPIKYRFVLGGKNLSQTTSDHLTVELKELNDLLVLDEITDSAVSLTQRSLLSFKTALATQNFKYILKCDEDSYVDLLRLSSVLQRRNTFTRLYWGEMVSWEVYTDGVYGETEYSVCDMYMPYAVGGGYVLSRDVVKLIVDNVDSVKLYKCEDVAIGAWLAPYNLEWIHDARFNTGAASRGCKEPFIVSHKVGVDEMYSKFESYQREGTFCSWRNFQNKGNGYLYDWTKLPTMKYLWTKEYP